jgi:hypothetical protein
MEYLKNREELALIMPRNGLVAEVGVWQGEYSNSILFLNRPKKLYLIDLWGSAPLLKNNTDPFGGEDSLKCLEHIKKIFKEDIDNGRIELRVGYSTDISNEFEDNYFDWVYIDADHSYTAVLNDLKSYAPKVKNDGYICGHDYVTDEQRGWKTHNPYGVVRAVDEFCEKYKWEIIYLTSEIDTGDRQAISYALRRVEEFLR